MHKLITRDEAINLTENYMDFDRFYLICTEINALVKIAASRNRRSCIIKIKGLTKEDTNSIIEELKDNGFEITNSIYTKTERDRYLTCKLNW